MTLNSVLYGNCKDRLKELADNSISSIVTDPPYEIGFMGRGWDSTGIANDPEMWAECYRVLKPGGYVLSFGATRTYHRMASAIEDAGFEIRDSIHWTYGSGFPKSMDLSKQIDKVAGTHRGKAGKLLYHSVAMRSPIYERVDKGEPITEDAKKWEGWGTALKPAHEPIVWARKPFSVIPLGDEATLLHHLIGALLWVSLSPAKRAALNSMSNRAGQNEVLCVSALVSVALSTSRDESVETDMFNSRATESTFWNIVSSWSNILGALLEPATISTTLTKSSMTTELRTLNSILALAISPVTMPRCECLLSGQLLSARSVINGSSVDWQNWLNTLKGSALESVIESIVPVVELSLAKLARLFSGEPGGGSSALESVTTGAEEKPPRPAHEPIVMARKPFAGTVANNVLQHGTGALNIDGSRISSTDNFDNLKGRPITKLSTQRDGESDEDWKARVLSSPGQQEALAKLKALGRWPANVILTHSAECKQIGLHQDQTAAGSRTSTFGTQETQTGGDGSGGWEGQTFDTAVWECVEGCPCLELDTNKPDSSRYFYQPTWTEHDIQTNIYMSKAAKKERNAGLEGMAQQKPDQRTPTAAGMYAESMGGAVQANYHPTVKPLNLMRYLIKMVTPEGGTVLDPFLGSGTTAVAAILEGHNWTGCELTTEYADIIEARIAWAEAQTVQPQLFEGHTNG